ISSPARPTVPRDVSHGSRHRRMKKHLFLALRILLAAAGVAFIALSLTWRDTVVLPAGWEVAGAPLAEPAEADVVTESIDARGRPQGLLELEVTLGDDRVEQVVLHAEQLDTGPQAPR